MLFDILLDNLTNFVNIICKRLTSFILNFLKMSFFKSHRKLIRRYVTVTPCCQSCFCRYDLSSQSLLKVFQVVKRGKVFEMSVRLVRTMRKNYFNHENLGRSNLVQEKYRMMPTTEPHRFCAK